VKENSRNRKVAGSVHGQPPEAKDGISQNNGNIPDADRPLTCVDYGAASEKKSFVDTTNLIRSIQRSEGQEDCFLRKTSCDNLDCIWRDYCFKPAVPAE